MRPAKWGDEEPNNQIKRARSAGATERESDAERGSEATMRPAKRGEEKPNNQIKRARSAH